MSMISLHGIERQITCAEREVALRKRVYPRFIESGRITKLKADDEIATMEAIVVTLRSMHRLLSEIGSAQAEEGRLL